MPAKTCVVSFTDRFGLEHSVSVAAETLNEAAVLGLAAFRKSEFAEHVAPGVGARLRVSVREETTYEVELRELENWLDHGTCKGPRDVLRKRRLREALGLTP